MPAAGVAPPVGPWLTGEIVLRLRANLGTKIWLSLVLSAGFWTAYLLLQRHPLFPVRVVSPMLLDKAVPFLPGAVYLYESLWLLMPLGPWLMKTKAELNGYALGLVAISLVGFAIFCFFPTACPRPAALQNANSLYRALVQMDGDLHAFPSLHCALAVFHGACCHAVFRQGLFPKAARWFIWIWVLGIIVSTLLTKQHVCLDALGGSLLGAAGCFLLRCPDGDSEMGNPAKPL